MQLGRFQIRLRESRGTEPLLPLAATLFICLLAGCSHEPKFASAKAAGFQDYTAPILEPDLSPTVKADGISLSKQFVACIDRKDYPGAEKMMAPALRSRWPVTNLKKDVEQGAYKPLVGSSGWAFDQVQGLRHGKQMVVHAHFEAKDKNLYHVNFSYSNLGGEWLIDMVMSPVVKTKPVAEAVSGQPMKKPSSR